MRVKFLFTGLFIAVSLFSQPLKEVSLKKIIEGDYSEKRLSQFFPYNGESYTCLNDDRSMIVAVSYKTGKPVDTLFNARKARECKFNDIEGYIIGPNGYRIIVWRNSQSLYGDAYTADYYDFDVRRNFITPLSDTGGQLRTPLFSPDGRMCAYVKDNDIWLRKFDFNTESAVTKDGKYDSIMNGCCDHLYGTAFGQMPMMAWTGDSKLLSFVKLDIGEVGSLEYMDYGSGGYSGSRQIKYSLAGTPVAKATVHSYSVDSRDIKELRISGGDYVPMLCTASNPEQVAVMTLNRTQNTIQIYYLNPKSGLSRLILREESQTYIDPEILKSINFFPDGFTFMSDRDGYLHLYFYSPTGMLTRQLTAGSWDVTAFRGFDLATKNVYYESTEEGSVYRTLYRIDAKGNKTKLSTKKGVNRTEFSADFRHFIEYHSTLNTPVAVSVCDANGTIVRVIEDNQRLKDTLSALYILQKELLTITNSDGDELNAWMLKPAAFDASKKYPIVVWQNSEQGRQSVLDQYAFGWEYYLASKGFIVLFVDVRGTGGRGTLFGKSNHMNLGLVEADDLQSIAYYLQSLPYVDPNRLAIGGWGYGGFTTLMAMSKEKSRYKAGIAIAPVTDLRLYNAALTERYMLTPGENFSGYDNCSPMRLAGKMEGALYLIHPTLDEVVHPQHSFLYAKALEEANKFCQTMFFTGKGHTIEGVQSQWNLYEGIVRFLESNL